MNKKTLKLVLKLILTGLAVFLVFRKIDTDQLLLVLQSASWFWLFPAFLLFILSKVFTALRLNLYFRNIDLYISEKKNLILYAIGMFYNLFLPGGIGGDGYKVYLLNKHFKIPVKSLLQAVLLDRLGGLVSIILLLLGLLLVVDIDLIIIQEIPLSLIAIILILLTLPVFYLITKYLFGKFLPSFLQANGFSLLGQISQMIAAYFILLALGIDEKILEYQFIFLLSSIVAVLPLTIGGVGARELVFIYSHEYIGIDKNAAVAFSLIFFLISAIASLIGSILKIDLEKSDKDKNSL
ncbi:flippase-like domain-containing protein [Belliella sp. DSM 107340]|uniref:Flippase-like domain-containing protein n=1 Tax=Belliella calami TaxID=2923436 RepID=A0ABS9UM86_9BACT|nr:flippase-like domain-containing protein [Belliella calami]